MYTLSSSMIQKELMILCEAVALLPERGIQHFTKSSEILEHIPLNRLYLMPTIITTRGAHLGTDTSPGGPYLLPRPSPSSRYGTGG